MLQLKPSQIQRAIDRAVPLRMRSDLEVSPRYVRGQLCLMIKDPVTLSHHRLWQEEFSLLEMLDGQTSLADMKRRFEVLYPAARIDMPRLEALLTIFYRNGLVWSERPGQAESLRLRHDQWKAQQRQGFANLLSLRLPGFNPDRLLQRLDQSFGWMLSPSILIVAGVMMLASWLYFLLHLQDLPADLSSLQAYLTPANLLWLFVALCSLKLLHELGHGLACVHYGGQCHEMGIMLLAFVPTLYCDVTDAWTIQSRWQRAFVAAAGMWFEMLAATVCAWLWWASQPGLVHSICFNAMIVGTVSTLLVNGNPLLRYDGYFILSDCLDLPNLWQQARTTLKQQLDRVFYRRPTLVRTDAPDPLPSYMSLYALLSIAYQGFVVAILLILIYTSLRNAKLELLGALLVTAVSMSVIRKPVIGFSQLVGSTERRQHLRWLPTIGLLAVLVGLAILMCVPFSYSIRVPVLLQMSETTLITIVEPGTLVDVMPEGTQVRQDQTIAQLASPQLELELTARQGELSRQSSKLFALQSKRADDALVASQITTVQEAIRGLTAEVNRLKAAQEKLSIRAPLDGVILAPQARQPTVSEWDTPEEMRWSGTPLDTANRGCYLASGESLCAIARPTAWQAIAFLDQQQTELLEPHSQVTVKSSQAIDTNWSGAVSHVTTQPLSKLPEAILQSGLIPIENSTNQAHAVAPIYIATLAIEPGDVRWVNADVCPPLHNSLGFAKIQVAPQSLAYRAWQLLDETFTAELTTE